jgi:hypothetical protein
LVVAVVEVGQPAVRAAAVGPVAIRESLFRLLALQLPLLRQLALALRKVPEAITQEALAGYQLFRGTVPRPEELAVLLETQEQAAMAVSASTGTSMALENLAAMDY